MARWRLVAFPLPRAKGKFEKRGGQLVPAALDYTVEWLVGPVCLVEVCPVMSMGQSVLAVRYQRSYWLPSLLYCAASSSGGSSLFGGT